MFLLLLPYSAVDTLFELVSAKTYSATDFIAFLLVGILLGASFLYFKVLTHFVPRFSNVFQRYLFLDPRTASNYSFLYAASLEAMRSEIKPVGLYIEDKTLNITSFCERILGNVKIHCKCFFGPHYSQDL